MASTMPLKPSPRWLPGTRIFSWKAGSPSMVASGGIDADRAAESDDRAHAFKRALGAVKRKHAAQAPADQAHLASRDVVQVTDFLRQGAGVLAAKTQVASQPPGVHLVA